MYGESYQSPAGGSPSAAARNQRYTYLVGRLRNRQMTMEEATELFGLMDGMLRASEAARAASLRIPSATPPPPAPPPPKPVAPAGPSAADDLFLVGLLAMGAGAGLLAAMTKRLQDLTPPAPATRSDSTGTKPSPR